MSGRVAVAMSGGVDSSVVAWLLSREDPSVIGLSMLLWDRSQENTHGRCCGALDLGDARRVAQQCGIAHYTLKMADDFRRYVVDPFVDDYLAGRTPVPCTRCNTFIKFDLFLERARAFGVDTIATGHYARIVAGAEGWELHQARTIDKDQSYYLFELTQAQLAASRFPLGDMDKERVRELAREAELLVAEKAESMELCFVAGGIKDFVEAQAGAAPERFAVPVTAASSLVDSGGTELGRGEPYYRYTVGQRRGLGLTAPSPLYVLAIEPEENRVVVGGAEELRLPGLIGERLHWIGRPPVGPIEATVRIRSRHPGVCSLVTPLAEDGLVRVEFATAQRGVAPGQAAVFYDGTRVLGGCWIQQATPA
ncbi:MAG: tRNA 2-thiouridine(34) synthase MnmA [Acidobacteria bacterium]|nr:tRNA 2-thiouridine(34) synthase MnmA [Acidobacteriota bacterium]